MWLGLNLWPLAKGSVLHLTWVIFTTRKQIRHVIFTRALSFLLEV